MNIWKCDQVTIFKGKQNGLEWQGPVTRVGPTPSKYAAIDAPHDNQIDAHVRLQAFQKPPENKPRSVHI